MNHLLQRPRRLISIAMDWTRPKDPPMSLAQSCLIAELKRHQVPVTAKAWAVNHAGFDVRRVHQFVMQQASDKTDLALGAYVWHEPHTLTLLKMLRQSDFPGRIILGGPQISYASEGLEQYYPEADVFIRGYAESALTQLAQSTEEKPIITGVHYAGEPDMGLQAKVDFNDLASPYLTGVIQPQRFMRFETQRGCPFRCAFCQHREPNNQTQRHPIELKRVLAEIDWIAAHPVIQDIAVLDPTFNSGPHYLDVLDAFIEKQYTGKLALQCRTEMVNEAFLNRVEQLNKTGQVVLEFGLQTIHKNEMKIIQRPNNLKKVESVLRETAERNIATEVSLIFGLPEQTLRSFIESVQFCRSLNVPTIFAYPLMLLRGTPLHDQKEALGLIESTDVTIPGIERVTDNIPHVVASPTFTFDDWQKMADIAASLDEVNQQFHQSAPKMKNTLGQTLWDPTQRYADNSEHGVASYDSGSLKLK